MSVIFSNLTLSKVTMRKSYSASFSRAEKAQGGDLEGCRLWRHIKIVGADRRRGKRQLSGGKSIIKICQEPPATFISNLSLRLLSNV
jgi:hypothetical protein